MNFEHLSLQEMVREAYNRGPDDELRLFVEKFTKSLPYFDCEDYHDLQSYFNDWNGLNIKHN